MDGIIAATDVQQGAGTEVQAGAGTLVVLLHAWRHSPEGLASLVEAVRDAWPAAVLHVPRLPATTASLSEPNQMVANVLVDIDWLVTRADAHGQGFRQIVLVGHSLGGLFARKLYVVACGQHPDAPFEPAFARSGANGRPLTEPREWAGRVSRIVLLAGMNRGWKISHHLGALPAIVGRLGVLGCYLLRVLLGRWPLIFQIRRGSEFITQLRIQWLFMRDRPGAAAPVADTASDTLPPGRALVVQLLGSVDELVAPEDNVDEVTGNDFVYLEVPFSGHKEIIALDDPAHGAARKAVLLSALLDDEASLRDDAVLPADERFDDPDPSVQRVVFVMHGIRDVGYWTHKIARRIRLRAAASGEKWATETSSYGYFPILSFLLPWHRRRKIEWLMDEYTSAVARWPNARARISYVGHSHGTYLLARALELYPCVRFENVVFAGSVVSTRFDWRRFTGGQSRRVGKVLNFVASADWVVAFFPKLFQRFRWQDLGSAGHDGFDTKTRSNGVEEVRYVAGAHSAGIQERCWDWIAEFVISGRADLRQLPGRADSRDWCVEAFGRVPWVIWLLILLLVGLLAAGLGAVLWLLASGPLQFAFLLGLATPLFLWALWMALTRG